MPKDDNKEEQNILKVTWQQVVQGVVVAILLGILGWAGATINNALEEIDELKEWKTATETILNTDLKHVLENLNKSITGNSQKMGTLSADVKKLEILVNRMEVVFDRFFSGE
jgi:branched-subunit amino acid permease